MACSSTFSMVNAKLPIIKLFIIKLINLIINLSKMCFFVFLVDVSIRPQVKLNVGVRVSHQFNNLASNETKKALKEL